MGITVGYTIEKPLMTREAYTAYTAMARAVNMHNAACKPGETLWLIQDGKTCYTVVEAGTASEPEPAKPTLEEQIAAVQAAQTDTDALVVDQEYRLTLLELGVTENSEEDE